MKSELLNNFSGWYQDLLLHPEDYYLVLSDDMDSFYSCRYLKKKTGIEIGGFYAFGQGLYLTEEIMKSKKKPVFVDVACVKDGTMAFDNHRSMNINHMAINPNVITDSISNGTYFQKYNGSTLMLLVALYGGKDNLSELEKEIILALDSFYIGYYKENGAFRSINMFWLEKLELKEMLLPTLEKKNMQYFQDLISDYQLNERIFIDENGELFTYADILPHDKFHLVMPVEKSYMSKRDVAALSIADRSVFVAAETYNGKYVVNSLV